MNNYPPIQRQLLRDIYCVEPASARLSTVGLAGLCRADHSRQRRPPDAGPHVRDSAERRTPPSMAKFDTTNARSETGMGEKRSFSGSWKKGQPCLVPASAFYEPNYEAELKSVGWKI